MTDAGNAANARGRRIWRAARLPLLGVCLVGAGWLGLREAPDVTSAQIRSALVTRADLEVAVEAVATLEPVDIVTIGAQVNGQIKRIAVQQGDRVRRGDLLVVIDPELQEAALEKARASLASMEAQLTARRATLAHRQSILARQRALAREDANTRLDVEQAELEYEVAKSELAVVASQIVQARLDVRSAEVNLTYTQISSPIDGEVLAIFAQFGQTLVSAQASPALLVVGNIDRMRVRARVSEADVVGLKPGVETSFSVVGVDARTYRGTLQSVELPAESLRALRQSGDGAPRGDLPVYYYGTFDVDNADHVLLPFMTADVRIVKGVRQQVLTVPVAAIRRHVGDDGATVRVVGRDGRNTPRTVQLGPVSGGWVEVRAGLDEGERVVLGRLPDELDEAEGAGQAP